MDQELRKSFSELKNKCKTSSQRKAFNDLIKSFSNKKFITWYVAYVKAARAYIKDFGSLSIKEYSELENKYKGTSYYKNLLPIINNFEETKDYLGIIQTDKKIDSKKELLEYIKKSDILGPDQFKWGE